MVVDVVSAGILDIIIEQNATFELDIYWVLQTTPQKIVNISNYTGKMQIRDAVGSSNIFYTLLSTTGTPSYTSTVGTGSIIIGGSDGHVELFIPANITDNFTWTTGVYDLFLTSPNDTTTKLLGGKVTVSPAATTI